MAALPSLGRSASQLASQRRLSPPGPVPASACPMSVSLVVIRLELAEHSPVPAGFGFSAAGESRGLGSLPSSPAPGPERLALPEYRPGGKAAARAFVSGRSPEVVEIRLIPSIQNRPLGCHLWEALPVPPSRCLPTGTLFILGASPSPPRVGVKLCKSLSSRLCEGSNWIPEMVTVRGLIKSFLFGRISV